jgi:2-haloacid dehalogenase
MTDELGGVTVLAFDIFGTTVDWRTGVAAGVARVAGRAGVDLDAPAFADAWRDRYLPALAGVREGRRPWAYLDALHAEALDDLLAERGLAASFGPAERAELVLAWHHLPAWPDAAAGLARLRTRYTVAALSNGGFALLTRLVKHAGLPVDCVLSAELARAYKPEPAAYRTAAALLDVPPGQVLMVATHAWDLAGARGAGLRTAYVDRPGERPGKPDEDPGGPWDLHVADFGELADHLGC